MTPFAQLEKSAGVNISQLGNLVSRAWKGFSRAPGDIASALSGRGMSSMSEIGKELGRAGQIGNVVGTAGAAGGLLYGAQKFIDKLTKDKAADPRNIRYDSKPKSFSDRIRTGAWIGDPNNPLSRSSISAKPPYTGPSQFRSGLDWRNIDFRSLPIREATLPTYEQLKEMQKLARSRKDS